MLPINQIICGDTIQEMSKLPNGCIDMVLADLPYGKTARNDWDKIIKFEDLWKQYDRITKDNSAIVLTSNQPFTTMLISSNMKDFKYSWIWNKINKISGFLNSKKQPLRVFEEVLVFYKKQCTYNPQMVKGKPYTATSSGNKSNNYRDQKDKVKTICNGKRYPLNIINIEGDERGTVGRIHPTQKPIALFEYLIKTYTNENDIVLDNTSGSCTTAIAAIRTNRKYICIDNNPEYCEIGRKRVEQECKNV